ncbi:MAG: NERD domain-containing protein [Fibrobacterales bacterium]|nr:NERD domain-containing protein [Fibrobacterales bacterium]
MDKPKSIGATIKRLPGQGLREKRDELFDALAGWPAMLAVAGVTILTMEWLYAFEKVQPNIWRGVLLAAISMAYFGYKAYRTRHKLRSYKRGEEGERIVAQAIEQDLVPLGYVAFHDIPLEKDGRRFNIDHLLVGPNGIFAIETKYYTKPAKGSPEVKYDGKQILWNGVAHRDRDEIAQTMNNAQSARTLISELTGMNVFVHPVLCAVGWYAKSNDLYGNPVLLTMEKTLKGTIPNVAAKQELSVEDRNRIIAALRRSAQ